jgi:glycosyltransferase involved in cell wall biosynthesis
VVTRPPAVSIAIRAFRRRWLAEAIESVLSQTERDLELVIYDDAGDLEDVATSFGDGRVRYHRPDAKRGPSGRFAAAVELCRGELIGVLDDDDRYAPCFVARMRAALEHDARAGVAFCDARIVQDGHVQNTREARAAAAAPGYDTLRAIVGRTFQITPSRMLFRRAALNDMERLRPMPDGIAPDVWVNVHAGLAGWRLAAVEGELVCVRFHSDRISFSAQGYDIAVDTWRALGFDEAALESLRRRELARALIRRAAFRVAGSATTGARHDLREAREVEPGTWCAVRRTIEAATRVGRPAGRPTATAIALYRRLRATTRKFAMRVAEPVEDDQPVRVLVNAVSARVGGGLTYAVEQLGALAAQPGLDLTVVAVEPAANRLRSRASQARVVTIPRRPLPIRLAWEQSLLAWRGRRFDVIYGIGNFALLAATTPQVVTFQNPNHFGAGALRVNRRFSSRSRRLRLVAERLLAHASARRARVSIAISASLRNCMLEDLPDVRHQLVLSAPPVVDDADGPTRPLPELPDAYILSVANDYPHKDWLGLTRAFAAAADLPPLVLVGEPGASARAPWMRQRCNRVIFWGPEPDRSRLERLYRGASAFVAHSHLEAFPLTPIEALSRRISVAASDIPTHREVCQEQAEYYNPDDAADLASAVRRALRSGPPSPTSWEQRTWDHNAAELAAMLRAAKGSPGK